MEDQDERGGPYSRKEIQEFVFALLRNCNWLGLNVVLSIWYMEFKKFLEEQYLLNNAMHIWNADEAGFPLCATSGKVLTIRGCKNVYAITADTKEQITILCAVSASREAIPPMHMFSGVRFKYNPMRNSVPGAYFGHSPSGWINAELWLLIIFPRKLLFGQSCVTYWFVYFDL